MGLSTMINILGPVPTYRDIDRLQLRHALKVVAFVVFVALVTLVPYYPAEFSTLKRCCMLLMPLSAIYCFWFLNFSGFGDALDDTQAAQVREWMCDYRDVYLYVTKAKEMRRHITNIEYKAIKDYVDAATYVRNRLSDARHEDRIDVA